MEYYNLVVLKEIIDPEEHKRTWMHDLFMSKIFSSHEKAWEYWETWKKANIGTFHPLDTEHHYVPTVNKIILDSDVEDQEIDDLMFEEKRYYVSVEYFAAGTRYNSGLTDKYNVHSSGCDRIGQMNTKLNFDMHQPGYLTIRFFLESTPASLQFDAEEKARLIVESGWIKKIDGLIDDCNPTHRWINIKSDSIKDFLAGNFYVDSSAKAIFKDGQGKFV